MSTKMSFVILSVLMISTFALEELSCHLPSNFTLELTEGRIANISDVKLTVLFGRNTLDVFTYPDTKEVNFLINEIIVIFEGKILTENSYGEPLVINKTFQTRALGIANSVDILVFNGVLQECQLFLPRNSSDRGRFPYEIENEIYRLAAKCMDVNLCYKIGNLQSEDYASLLDPFDFGPLSVDPKYQKSNPCSEPLLTDSELKKKASAVQSTLNAIVDVAIAQGIKELQKRDFGTIPLPKINETFTTGSGFFKTIGHILATDGFFSDLSTIKRTNNIVFDRDGEKFSASCGLGLSKAFVQYDYYQLKYGIIKTNGFISADIRGVAIEAKLAVDYGQKPCNATLEYLRVSQFGKFKINIGGVGILNSPTSSIVTWLTKKWKLQIIKRIEALAKKFIVSQVEKFKCEKYKPL